jgi:hypothetical protein
MTGTIIEIENMEGPFQVLLERVIRMVPGPDQKDDHLRRLLAFRIRIDGEGATQEYVIQKVRDFIRCGHKGRFYDFIKDDNESKTCLENDDVSGSITIS